MDRGTLAHRTGLARETLIRIERQQRDARSATTQRLAEVLLVAPSMLTGSSDLDASIDEPVRACTDCGALRPARAFLPIAGTRNPDAERATVVAMVAFLLCAELLSSQCQHIRERKRACRRTGALLLGSPAR
jgi:transcriptional regulator with XRE-family HTH domain